MQTQILAIYRLYTHIRATELISSLTATRNGQCRFWVQLYRVEDGWLQGLRLLRGVGAAMASSAFRVQIDKSTSLGIPDIGGIATSHHHHHPPPPPPHHHHHHHPKNDSKP